MSTLTDEVFRRRTFAIISHPDAGKAALTEKLLLFGGYPIGGPDQGAASGVGCARSGWRSSASAHLGFCKADGFRVRRGVRVRDKDGLRTGVALRYIGWLGQRVEPKTFGRGLTTKAGFWCRFAADCTAGNLLDSRGLQLSLARSWQRAVQASYPMPVPA